jgi:hypothetical protein
VEIGGLEKANRGSAIEEIQADQILAMPEARDPVVVDGKIERIDPEFEHVIAEPADQPVKALVAGKAVVALTAPYYIVAIATEELVVTLASLKSIIAVRTDEPIIAITSFEAIVTRVSEQLIVAFPTHEDIGQYAAVDLVALL